MIDFIKSNNELKELTNSYKEFEKIHQFFLNEAGACFFKALNQYESDNSRLSSIEKLRVIRDFQNELINFLKENR
ncbi:MULTISPECIES: hypothetical protein [Campylobacter]|uniref:Uncharacterized protein n=1 Tax=Campylobacter porcelli TaxID=1660073 RepID=A0ABU7M4G8_9BACT|nr:hypothetical protein [Campylobacter sp. P0124]MCR8696997.1 hypothetical protein [Campylobacter sp. RM19073]MEE3704586.1 hypothetical protein [Campylobacter sp. CX2-8023-23]MEE3744606.1 hypothetical protein [Campylobacter sp. CX2-4855-23]MEE3776474.1 hypothetical protein [Campylobacter sp. CX2-4080-23]